MAYGGTPVASGRRASAGPALHGKGFPLDLTQPCLVLLSPEQKQEDGDEGKAVHDEEGHVDGACGFPGPPPPGWPGESRGEGTR